MCLVSLGGTIHITVLGSNSLHLKQHIDMESYATAKKKHFKTGSAVQVRRTEERRFCGRDTTHARYNAE